MKAMPEAIHAERADDRDLQHHGSVKLGEQALKTPPPQTDGRTPMGDKMEMVVFTRKQDGQRVQMPKQTAPGESALASAHRLRVSENTTLNLSH